MRIPLRTRVFLGYVLIIGLFTVLGIGFGIRLIHRAAIQEARYRVDQNLQAVWSVLDGMQSQWRLLLSVLGGGRRVARAYAAGDAASARLELEAVRLETGLDFLSLTDTQGRVVVRTVPPYTTGDVVSSDPLIRSAMEGEAVGGFAVLGQARLRAEGGDLGARALVILEQPAGATLQHRGRQTSGMAIIAAAPARDERGEPAGVIYGGVLLNRNHGLTDRVHSIACQDRLHRNRASEVVSIFQSDVRIATNELDSRGQRQIGSRASPLVSGQVLKMGQSWHDSSFSVTKPYLSAYRPIADSGGAIIGMLHVGILERQFDQIGSSLGRLLVSLSLLTVGLALLISLLLARRIAQPIRLLSQAAARIAEGEWRTELPAARSHDEIGDLTLAFGMMADALHDRQSRLRRANEELEQKNVSLQELNGNYLDLLGMVSHELNNSLGEILWGARSLDEGLVGELTPPQVRIVHGIRSSIESAVDMAHNYLDLARIETGRLELATDRCDLMCEVVIPTLEEFQQTITQRGVVVEKDFPPQTKLIADRSLLRIVYRNLIGNALKYGRVGGRILLRGGSNEGFWWLEAWNDGPGLAPDQLAGLFTKFGRVKDSPGRLPRGTGLGLFIAREIILRHGGTIRAQSQPGEWINFLFSLPIGEPCPHTLESSESSVDTAPAASAQIHV